MTEEWFCKEKTNFDLQKIWYSADDLWMTYLGAFKMFVIQYFSEDIFKWYIFKEKNFKKLFSFYSKLFHKGDQHTIIDVQIAMVEHFLYGVCTLKGHKLINKIKDVNEI